MTHFVRCRNFAASMLCVPALAAALLFTAATATVASSPAAAQRPASARTVEGTVTKGGAPVKGAVVHLKDTRSLSQKSYITAEDGTYRFAQLSSTTDYEVWADAEGEKTSTKTISSFDNKSSFTIPLKF